MEFIRPDINVDFMGRRKLFFGISGAAVLVSLVSLLVFGLNLGIDFKGGTKLIVAFKSDADVERGKIKETVEALVAKETGQSGTQVEVQDFDIGTEAGEEARRFVVFTELTTLVSDAKKDEIRKALKAKFGEDLRVDIAEEGEDKFYLQFPAPAGVNARTAEIAAEFAALGYSDLDVESEEERRLDMEHYKSVNLAEQDATAAVEDSAAAFEASEKVYELEKQKKLEAMQDATFTVTIKELGSKATTAMREAFGDGFIEVESSTSVSSSVGRDLLNQGLIAILYALIGILIYIALRFDFRYSPGAVVALMHDTIITLGVFALVQVKFTQPIIAALLTIIGYSLNDTIVVYDRIRENVQKFRSKSLSTVINESINETLSRTILTSGTTLLVVVSILFLGGGLIRDFAFALFIGIVVGTYSSIAVASPLIIYLEAWFKKREEAAKAREQQPATATPK